MSRETAPPSQLLANRGILTKINAVVRKKSKAGNTQVPPEWNPETAQAYRLLVGPKIADYMPPEAMNNLDEDDTENVPGVTTQYADVRHTLVPSRLGVPYKPLKVRNSDIEALQYPSDLLVHVFPSGHIKKFDLLNRRAAQKQRKIVKPLVKDPSVQSCGSGASYSFSRPLSPLSEGGRMEEEDFAEENHEEYEEILINEANATEEEEKGEPKRNIQDEIIHRVNTSARERMKGMTRLRAYFYVLRCWAHYKANARIKAAFLAEVHETQVALHVFEGWHGYVETMRRLRNCRSAIEEKWDSRLQRVTFYNWKNRAQRAINNASSANLALAILQRDIMKNVLRALKEAAHSQRVCRREITKMFRFQPNGPFTPINDYFTRKRDMNIKALNHFFVKTAPSLVRGWHAVVLRTHRDNGHIAQVHQIIRRIMFKEWYEIYKDHFHYRILEEIRRKSIVLTTFEARKEKEAADKVEKTVMIQLVRDRSVLTAKLNQFDRLSQNHYEAVIRRDGMRSDIGKATNEFFRRQEELQLIDFAKQASDVDRKTREVRMQLADGFLYHLGRAVRSYDNQVVAHQFCLAFRALSQPIVEKAIGYFYEKRHIKSLLAAAGRERKALQQVCQCTKLYHQATGWKWWRAYMEKMNQNRSAGLMAVIRRRTIILQMYPYFNWTEVLPVRPPRPLKEVEQMFKDLPLVSIQRKVARERVHHVNVKMMLMRRRILRDFIRAYAAFVQTQVATREVMRLMRKKQHLKLFRRVFDGFRANATKKPLELKSCKEVDEINANISAWFRHFFRERVNQQAIISRVPLS